MVRKGDLDCFLCRESSTVFYFRTPALHQKMQELRTAVDLSFAEKIVDMFLDRRETDDECLTDLLVREAFRHQSEYLSLAFRQMIGLCERSDLYLEILGSCGGHRAAQHIFNMFPQDREDLDILLRKVAELCFPEKAEGCDFLSAMLDHQSAAIGDIRLLQEALVKLSLLSDVVVDDVCIPVDCCLLCHITDIAHVVLFVKSMQVSADFLVRHSEEDAVFPVDMFLCIKQQEKSFCIRD